MSDAEAFLRAFHARRPDVTSRAFSRAGSYEKLAARVPATGRVLDLACGDGILVRLLGTRAIGIDLAPSPGGDSVVQGRAQALPFAAASFDAATCHLAFMLFDELEQVVTELHRVLVPGAPFMALVGGGPTAGGDDAFHAFASMLPGGQRFGDRRASSEAGWQELFVARGWRDLAFDRWELDLSGRFDEVWQLLGSSYQLAADDADSIRRALRELFPADHVPCIVSAYLATVIR